MLGLLLGYGLRRSKVVGLRLDQPQLRESHWAIVDLEGKGGRIRTVPVPNWCKGLVDVWLRHSGVNEGKVSRRVLKNGARQDAGVTANVAWYAVKRCAKQAGIAIWHLTIFVAAAHASAMDVEANSNRFSFCSAMLRCKRLSGTIGCKQKLKEAVNDRFVVSVADDAA